MQSVNDAQFSIHTDLFLSSASLVAASAPVPVIAIVPFTIMYRNLTLVSRS